MSPLKEGSIPASVYRHPDVLGAGAAKRKKLKGQQKVEAVMHEFGTGTLRSGSGEHVTSRRQAIAIAMSEARRSLSGGKKK